MNILIWKKNKAEKLIEKIEKINGVIGCEGTIQPDACSVKYCYYIHLINAKVLRVLFVCDKISVSNNIKVYNLIKLKVKGELENEL